MENTAPADALVLFGAMGNLAHKKIFPALYHMIQHGHLDVPGRTNEHLKERVHGINECNDDISTPIEKVRQGANFLLADHSPRTYYTFYALVGSTRRQGRPTDGREVT